MALDLTRGQLVTAVIERIVCVALDFDPFNSMFLCKCQDFFPEILVFYGLFVAFNPVAAHPIFQPALPESIDKLGAVGINLYDTRFL